MHDPLARVLVAAALIGLAFFYPITAGALVLAWIAYRVVTDRRKDRHAISARADEQASLAMSGDPRGTHGIYPPAV